MAAIVIVFSHFVAAVSYLFSFLTENITIKYWGYSNSNGVM